MGVGGVYARGPPGPDRREPSGDDVDGRGAGLWTATVFPAICAMARNVGNAPLRAVAIFAPRPFGAPSNPSHRPPERSRAPLPASAEPIDSWSRVDRELRAAVPEAAYRIYLEPLRPLDFAGGVLRVAAPPATHRWVIDRFGRVLQACAAAALGPDIEVDVLSADPGE